MSEVDALAGQLVGLFQPTITSLQTHLSEVTANQQALLETIKQEEEQFIDTEKLKEIEQMFAQIPAYNQKLHNIRAIMTDLQKRCANIHRITSGLDGEVRAKEMKVASSHAKKVLTGGQVCVCVRERKILYFALNYVRVQVTFCHRSLSLRKASKHTLSRQQLLPTTHHNHRMTNQILHHHHHHHQLHPLLQPHLLQSLPLKHLSMMR
eukprot:c469_g1_i2.p1 GENE.c469_g1_i2~~c469_g1_i2.p1  ORF type:complete len:208 (-),score=34.82 c469_g1_i2:215-838(-)